MNEVKEGCHGGQCASVCHNFLPSFRPKASSEKREYCAGHRDSTVQQCALGMVSDMTYQTSEVV
jgi:hypothetical protein